MALSQITAKTKITASTLNGIIDVVNSLQTANPTAYITKTWVSGTSWCGIVEIGKHRIVFSQVYELGDGRILRASVYKDKPVTIFHFLGMMAHKFFDVAFLIFHRCIETKIHFLLSQRL